MKGYKGDYGLERYKEFETFNLGSQVSVEDLARFARDERIDALLASQVVTQKGSDIANFTALTEILEAEGIREQVLLIAGGPRMTNLLAAELGYDAGFGREHRAERRGRFRRPAHGRPRPRLVCVWDGAEGGGPRGAR